MSGFPALRLRRLRCTPALRRLVRETTLSVDDLIYPIFVRHGKDERRPISSMPGQFQWSVDRLPALAAELVELRIPGVILFGLPAEKDPVGVENYAPDGIVQQAIRTLKDAAPELAVMTDVCACEYTDHGHCGILNDHASGRVEGRRLPEGYVLNDATLELLQKIVASHAEEGADILMVKPALPYLDILHRVRQQFDRPVAAYQVSGEYAMVKAAAQNGWLDERTVAFESLTAIKRAGADMILTYWAPAAAQWLREG